MNDKGRVLRQRIRSILRKARVFRCRHRLWRAASWDVINRRPRKSRYAPATGTQITQKTQNQKRVPRKGIRIILKEIGR